MRAAEAALLGLLHGPAELLPVSSSAHVALAGAHVDQAAAVAFHAGTAAALLDHIRCQPELLVPAGAVTAAAALLAGNAAEARLRSRGAMAAGMLAGAAALALADRRDGARADEDAGWRDGLALGLAQAAALWPGVSRNGATLAAARARGFGRSAAQALSFRVGVPTLAGAAALKGARMRPTAAHAVGAAAAFASTLAARPLVRAVRDDRPLWPWAAYRTGVALLLVRGSRW